MSLIGPSAYALVRAIALKIQNVIRSTLEIYNLSVPVAIQCEAMALCYCISHTQLRGFIVHLK